MADNVQVVYIFSGLLSGCSIQYWKQGIKISNYYCRIVCFPLQFCHFLLHIFSGFIGRLCVFIIFRYLVGTDLLSAYNALILSCNLFLLNVYFVWPVLFGYHLNGISFSILLFSTSLFPYIWSESLVDIILFRRCFPDFL